MIALMACHPAEELSGDLVFADANNYSYIGDLSVQSTNVASGTDASVDWSALTTDIRARGVDPAAIDEVLLLAFGPGQEEILSMIADNSLQQSDIQDYRRFGNDDGRTSAMLSEFSILGNDFLPETEFLPRESVGTWAVTFREEVDGRLDILTIGFVQPVEGEANTAIVVGDDTAALAFDVTFGDALVTGEGLTYTADWSAITEEASGQVFDSLRADRLFVGHLDVETEEEAAEVFVRLNEEADALYRMDVYGLTSADLADAVDDAWDAFPGFTTGGMWLLGLECTQCTSPAPVLLSIVEVR